MTWIDMAGTDVRMPVLDVAGESMAKSDVYQSIGGLTPEVQQRIIERLEFRGHDPVFVAMREAYLDKMDLAAAKRILDLGCGTGVVTRALARRNEVGAEIVGVDLSEALIAAARGFARDEGLSDRIDFRVGDCHGLDDADGSFDAVVTHTLISHVSDPAALIAQAARVSAPGGVIAIFDGDYSSMTFGAGDPELNAGVVGGILDATVANPVVMRELPDLLRQNGLEMADFLPELHAEAGQGSFFVNLAEAYVPMAVKAGSISEEIAPDWLADQRMASERGTFFAACNYYTYLARKPK